MNMSENDNETSTEFDKTPEDPAAEGEEEEKSPFPNVRGHLTEAASLSALLGLLTSYATMLTLSSLPSPHIFSSPLSLQDKYIQPDQWNGLARAWIVNGEHGGGSAMNAPA